MATAYNPQPLAKALIHKISTLPAERIAEVEDFVDFIGAKEARQREAQHKADRALTRAATAASAPAFAAVWDNPEDDVYDSI